MNKKQRDIETEDLTWELESKLEPGMLRFLAHVMENGLQAGLRTQHDFIRHFPPRDIMKGLADRPDLRANILVSTTGVRPKIALKKNAESAGEDLQIALDERETDAELIVSLFHPDDRVRYLDTARIWNYIIEPKFWTTEKKDGAAYERAKSHLAFILDRAIEDNLLTYRDIVDGITVGTVVQYLPPQKLQAVIEKALAHSHNGKPFSEQDLMSAVPSAVLVDHIPHTLIWDSVVVPKIAEKKELSSRSNKNGTVATGPKSSASSEYDVYEADEAATGTARGQDYGTDSVSIAA